MRRLLQQEGARGALIASGSTLAVFGLAIWFVVTSPNWDRVQTQFFSRHHFRESWPDVLGGFLVNIELFIYCMIAIPIVSLVVAVMRSLRGPGFAPLRVLATLFTDLLRGIPVYLLIILLGLGVPGLQIPGLTNSAKFWAVIALVVSYSAYAAEIYRAGIDAVPESQRSSARALGLTQWQSMRFAILPQAVRNVVPALMNLVVALQKDVALVSIVGVRDALREADIYTDFTFNYSSYIAATVLFLAVSIPLTRFVDWFTARDRRLRSQVAV